MTTPGATEAVTPPTPEELAYALYDAVRHMRPAEARAEIAKHLREAEVNALRRAAETAEAWVGRATQFPREFRYHAECNRAHEEQISGLGAAIRSLLPKEEGK